MNIEIVSALREFEKLIDAYITLDREDGSHLELELRNDILSECRRVQNVIIDNIISEVIL